MGDNTVHNIKDCEFKYVEDTLIKRIYMSLYMVSNYQENFEDIQFLLDTGAVMTCMSLNDIKNILGYDEFDVDYSDMTLCSGYQKGTILSAMPITVPSLVIGGFLLQNVKLYTNFKLTPKFISEKSIEEYKISIIESEKEKIKRNVINELEKIKYKTGLCYDSSLISNKVKEKIEEQEFNIYNRAFMAFYNSKIIKKNKKDDSYEQKCSNSKSNYNELTKYFYIDTPETSNLLGMDILHYFDIIITQPRYQLVHNNQPKIINGKLKSSGDNSTFVKGNLTSEGNLYFSIPDNTLYKLTKLSQTSLSYYSISKIEDLEYNDMFSNFNNGDYFKISSQEDISNTLSQGCQIIHNEYNIFSDVEEFDPVTNIYYPQEPQPFSDEDKDLLENITDYNQQQQPNPTTPATNSNVSAISFGSPSPKDKNF